MEMEVDTVLDTSGSHAYIDNVDAEDVEDNDSVEDFMFGNLFLEARIARETLTRVELDLACSLEKLANLNVLVMLVEMRGSDSFTSDQELSSTSSFNKALEFDLLRAILDSELREIDDFMPGAQIDISNVRKFISSHKHLGDAFLEIEVELDNAEESLKQLSEELSELKLQSVNLHSSLSKFSGEENWKSHGDEFMNEKADIRMQTAEQKRNVLRMLDKSLAAELDLVKKLEESRQTEEELKSLLCSSKQELLFLEHEVALIREKLFEAENSAEVLMGVIKEILGEEKQSMLYSTICCMESLIEDLKSRVSKAESRAENAEDNCNILSVYNSNLNGELSFLRNRLEYLEASLHQAKDTTAEAAKEIGVRTNMIATMVMQLSLERERLCKQILSLREENRLLRQKDEGREPDDSLSAASCAKESNGEEDDFSAAEDEGEPELEFADSATDFETERNISSRQLNFKHVLMAVAISASAALWFRLPQGQSSQ